MSEIDAIKLPKDVIPNADATYSANINITFDLRIEMLLYAAAFEANVP